MKFKAIYHPAPKLPSQGLPPNGLSKPSTPIWNVQSHLHKWWPAQSQHPSEKWSAKEAALPWGIWSLPQGHAGGKGYKGISWRSCFRSHSPALPENVSQSGWQDPSFFPPPSSRHSFSLFAEERLTSPSSRIGLRGSAPKCQGFWVAKKKDNWECWC